MQHSQFLISRIYASIVVVAITLFVTSCGGSGHVSSDSGPQTPTGDSPLTFGEHFVLFSARETADLPMQLYLGELDGSAEPTKLSDVVALDGEISHFESSPDRSAVAWVATYESGEAELFVVSARDDHPTKVSVVRKSVPAIPVRIEWAPDSSRLAFIADRNLSDTFKLYTCLPDGSDIREVSGSLVAGGNVSDFTWSSDSAQIAYLADQDTDGLRELYSSAPDGSSKEKLSEAVEIAQDDLADFVLAYHWSPDASRITYTLVSNEGSIGLFSNTPEGGNQLQLNGPLIPGGSVISYRWAPDSSRIAYLADQDINNVSELYTTPADESVPTKINPAMVSGGKVSTYAWAPDASLLAYAADQVDDSRFELFVDSPDGGNNQKISGPVGLIMGTDSGIRGFHWSPDSAHIAYISRHGPLVPVPGTIKTDLYIVLSDGSGRTKVSAGGNVYTQFVSWGPDSERIAWIDLNSETLEFELYTAQANGSYSVLIGAPISISSNTQPVFAWSADGSRIVHIANPLNGPSLTSNLGSSAVTGGDEGMVSGTTITANAHISKYIVR